MSSFPATPMTADAPARAVPLRRVAAWVLVTVGLCFLTLGSVGLVVPGWPTTIFWLLATFCFARSCPPLQQWIYRRGWVGRTVELVFEHRAITRRARLAASCGVATSLSASATLLAFLDRLTPGLAATLAGVLLLVLTILWFGLRTWPACPGKP